mgnify:CR=1 FL=1
MNVHICTAAVGRALLLAQEIAKFPQQCMRADRQSAYHAAFNSKNINEALKYEFERGIKVIEEESVQGDNTVISTS